MLNKLKKIFGINSELAMKNAIDFYPIAILRSMLRSKHGNSYVSHFVIIQNVFL